MEERPIYSRRRSESQWSILGHVAMMLTCRIDSRSEGSESQRSYFCHVALIATGHTVAAMRGQSPNDRIFASSH